MTKGRAVKAWEKYEVDGDEVESAESCPRCGDGTFLAQHGDRKTCGRCGFSESASSEKSSESEAQDTSSGGDESENGAEEESGEESVDSPEEDAEEAADEE